MNQSTLVGKTVLVTRPEKQSEKITKLIQQAGGVPLQFPVIDIEAISPEHWYHPQIEQQDWLIFVSRNAVTYFLAGIPSIASVSAKLATVGDGTAEAIIKNNLKVDLKPEQSIGSEGLLACPAFQDLRNQNVTIVRGEGGRELLADTLRSRGATIEYIEVYRRVMPNKTEVECAQAAQADILTATSVAGVSNLFELLKKYSAEITVRPLIVLSERIRQHAHSLGFTDVRVTRDASDNALMDSLMETR